MRDDMGLYRGKTTTKPAGHEFNEVWVYGDLLRSGEKCYIHPLANAFQVDRELTKLVIAHEVDPSTVCQYTGLTDRNGKRIFEGDVVRVTDDYDVCDHFKNADTGIGVVEFVCGLWYVGGQDSPNNGLWDLQQVCYIEVIGNIHDDKELLERGRE